MLQPLGPSGGLLHRRLLGRLWRSYVRLSKIDEVSMSGSAWLRRPVVGRRQIGMLGRRLTLKDGSHGENLLGFDLGGWTVTTSISGRILYCAAETNISALRIQSRSSSPSSDPPGPPRTIRNSLGCHSIPSSALLAASSRCMSSTFVFSSVAASWFLSLMASTVLYHNFCDSRSCCSSNGRTIGGVCFVFVALNKTSLWPV